MTPDEEQDEQFYRDTESIAFPKLDDHQLALLEPLGERRVVKQGELVYKAGQRDLGLTIVLRGELQAFEQRDGTEQVLATAHERDFAGDVAMLQGTAAQLYTGLRRSGCVLEGPGDTNGRRRIHSFRSPINGCSNELNFAHTSRLD